MPQSSTEKLRSLRSIFRHPKTNQEARACLDAKEQGVKVRAKRNRNNLPNAYDDIIVSEWHKRNICWKKKRKNKYSVCGECNHLDCIKRRMKIRV